MQTSNCNQTMTEKQQLAALSAYVTYLGAYIRYAHGRDFEHHFENFSTMVWANFYLYMDNKTDTESTVTFARQAFNYAHSYLEAKEPLSETIELVMGSDYTKYKKTIEEIIAQVSHRRIDTANLSLLHNYDLC